MILRKLAFEISCIVIVAALTYNIVAPLAAWLAGN